MSVAGGWISPVGQRYVSSGVIRISAMNSSNTECCTWHQSNYDADVDPTALTEVVGDIYTEIKRALASLLG